MAKRNQSRRGSIAFRPRKRADGMVPRPRYWFTQHKGVLGFAGYKAGMTHALMIEDRENALKGQEVARPVTIVEVPPIFVFSIVALRDTPHGLQVAGEVMSANAPKELQRAIPKIKAAKSPETLEKMDGIAVVRVHACTQPWKAGIAKSTPEVFELGLGGNVQEQFALAKSLLGKELAVKDVLQEGEFLDVIAVTKGKGWQGVVKRFGVALGPHKATKSRRHGGSIGPERQAKVMYTIPRAGQMGFHRRTEKNKRILKISDSTQEVTPAGGFLHYGIPKATTLIIEGSIPGPTKRFLLLRKNAQKAAKAELKEVATNSKQ